MIAHRTLLLTLFLSLALAAAGAGFLFTSVKRTDSAAIGVIGGSDGPTAIFVTVTDADSAPDSQPPAP